MILNVKLVTMFVRLYVVAYLALSGIKSVNGINVLREDEETFWIRTISMIASSPTKIPTRPPTPTRE